MDYTGYNPVTILNVFFERAKKTANFTGSWDIVDDKGDVILSISKQANPMEDLSLLVLVFTARGSVVWKILNKIQDQWVEPLREKCQVYGIATTKPVKAVPLGQKDITLARLAGVVPHLVMAFMSEGVGKSYVNMTGIEKAYGMIYPRAILTQMFAAMVPTAGVGSELISHCYSYAFLFDRVINPKKVIPDYQAYLRELQTFVDATWKSTLYTDDFRKLILDSYSLMDRTADSYVMTADATKIAVAGTELWMVIQTTPSAQDALKSIHNFLTAKPQITKTVSTQAPARRIISQVPGQTSSSPVLTRSVISAEDAKVATESMLIAIKQAVKQGTPALLADAIEKVEVARWSVNSGGR